MMPVMFKGILSLLVPAGLFYVGDEYLYEGRHVETLIALGRNLARSFGL
jgi:hypothetical protein